MNIDREILRIINSSTQPLGWYGIAIRLSMLGVIPETNLVTILQELESRGFIKHEETEGHPHGTYAITTIGKEYLGQDQI